MQNQQYLTDILMLDSSIQTTTPKQDETQEEGREEDIFAQRKDTMNKIRSLKAIKLTTKLIKRIEQRFSLFRREMMDYLPNQEYFRVFYMSANVWNLISRYYEILKQVTFLQNEPIRRHQDSKYLEQRAYRIKRQKNVIELLVSRIKRKVCKQIKLGCYIVPQK